MKNINEIHAIIKYYFLLNLLLVVFYNFRPKKLYSTKSMIRMGCVGLFINMFLSVIWYRAADNYFFGDTYDFGSIILILCMLMHMVTLIRGMFPKDSN